MGLYIIDNNSLLKFIRKDFYTTKNLLARGDKMISWVIIITLIIITIILVRAKEIKHRIWLAAIILFALFIILTFGHVSSSNNADLTTFEGLMAAGKFYFAWIQGVVANMFDISGYVVKQNWGINSTVIGK